AAFELGNLGYDRIDMHLDLPGCMPAPCIVHAVRRIVTTRRPESYGRPPPLWELLEKSRESRVDLNRVLCGLDDLLRDRARLEQIADATVDAFLFDDDDPQFNNTTSPVVDNGIDPF